MPPVAPAPSSGEDAVDPDPVPAFPASAILQAIEADPSFERLAAALCSGEPCALTAGAVTPGAVAPLLAALLRRQPRRVVVVAASEDDAIRLSRDASVAGEGLLTALTMPLLGSGSLAAGSGSDSSLEDPLPVTAGERLRALDGLRGEPGVANAAVFVSVGAMLEALPLPAVLDESRRRVQVGGWLDPQELCEELVAHGHVRVPMVESEGELALRGGIVDVFSPGDDLPLRIELDGDVVASLRRFDPHSQVSRTTVDQAQLLMVRPSQLLGGDSTAAATLLDHLAASGGQGLMVIVEPEQVAARAQVLASVRSGPGWGDHWLARARELGISSLAIRALARDSGEPGDDLATAPPVSLGGPGLEAVSAAVSAVLERGDEVTVLARREPQACRLRDLLAQAGVHAARWPRLRFGTSALQLGFAVRPAQTVVVTASDLLGDSARSVRNVSRRRAETRAIDSFLELSPGDMVVHVNHGVGRFRGVERIDHDGNSRDCLAIEYLNDAVLYVPAERLDLLQRYVGVKGVTPRLSSLKGSGWSRRTAAARKAVVDMAAELIENQVARELVEGTALPGDGEWQRAFEAAFPYEETEDQVRAVAETKNDMESSKPMDRLVCGDVGYGKTEVAMRAAFKCASAGKQVAVLVPTTVLAQQHQATFIRRMAEWPIRVDVLSRFRSPRQQREVIEGLALGEVDIIVGTHRLLGEDVEFHDLGLVIVDEEQRFGVRHKERLRRLCTGVDVLTLSATPIPRTLHMALVGMKDISTLQSPPPGRLAIRTQVRRFDPQRIRRAILDEIARDGQVYFVHDRVDTIDGVRRFLEREVSEARLLVVHGQLPERQIEDQMLRFVQGLADVLICTSIIENGLDIPRVNTILVNNADHFGLADLHQLRGRVGRYHHRAHCHLLVPRDRPVAEPALRRLQTVAEFSELGSGFRIAMRDLEIRGAGNILGAEQSGHVGNVGYEMYCRMLRQAIEERRGGRAGPEMRAEEIEVNLGVEAFIPEAYVGDVRLRMEVYRRLGRASTPGDVEALRREIRDRYGALPLVVESLFDLRLLRCWIEPLGVARLWQEDKVVGLQSPRMGALLEGLRPLRDRVRVVGGDQVYLTLDALDPPPEQVLAQLLEWFADPSEPGGGLA